MIRAIKILLVFCFAFIITQCGQNEKTGIDNKSFEADTIATTTPIQNNDIWVYNNYHPIGDIEITPERKKNILNKFKNLKFEIQDTVIKMEGKGTETIYTGTVSSLGFLKYDYMYNFYNKLLKKKYAITLTDSISYIRSKYPYAKKSILDDLFIEGFFLKDYFFVEENGFVISFRKGNE